jgi:hypothetical protein
MLTFTVDCPEPLRLLYPGALLLLSSFFRFDVLV